MRINAHNFQSVLNARPERLPDVLPQVFATLLDPDQDEIILLNYTGAIRQRFEDDERPDGQVKFDSFGEAAFEAGIVKTVLELTQITRTSMPCVIAGFHALDIIWHMLRTGNIQERRELLEQLLEYKMVDICLDKALNHPFCIHRQSAVNALRCLASESFLGEYISPSQTSEIMVKMCQFILTGPDFFISQMRDPTTTWQSCMCFGNHNASASKAARYAPRYYAMTQESAIWTVHGLLCRSPSPSPQFISETIAHNPELIDLLFQCAVFQRPPWYPETQVDSFACEALSQLFPVSPDIVPGVSLSESVLPKDEDPEWKGVLECVKLLTSRPNWVEKFIAVWNRIDGERWQDIKKMASQTMFYHALTPVDRAAFLAIFEYRGASRICMLRVIATLTHLADECDIQTSDLVSLLHIGHAACQDIKTMQQLSNEGDRCTWIERAFEAFRSPLYTVFTLDKVDPPIKIADESVMGPIAFVRLLAVLAQRGVLGEIPRWKKLPKGTSSSTSLPIVKQIVSNEGLRRTLSLAVKRVTGRREVGHRRIRGDGEVEYAGFAYSSAAELAAALVAFDVATKSKYRDVVRGVRKELVLCLGNAAEMALVAQQYERALNYALGANFGAENLPPLDAVDEEIVGKNQRRAERAKLGLASS
ncbi:hypothetical protein Hypma_007254 [Hypsizygus marmoreus]|uniref:Uncharacterized protein n=1 Tax=Hypsizygus marmoreus TaxID=39966 RepID=A0A369K7B6_HYPMA|nr:hypothetical protein Hypma_007254 [Hypsizygus marmoreus]